MLIRTGEEFPNEVVAVSEKYLDGSPATTGHTEKSVFISIRPRESFVIENGGNPHHACRAHKLARMSDNTRVDGDCAKK
jgi:hypothetical protein